jgi:hypothetical protein
MTQYTRRLLARVDPKLLVTPEALPCVMMKTVFAGPMLLQSCMGFEYCDFRHPSRCFSWISSSSYGLSLFSLKAGPRHYEGTGAVPGGHQA